MVDMVETYTTAPISYDGFGTERIEVVGLSVPMNLEVWKVRTPKEHVDWQRMRYASGNFLGCDEETYQYFLGWMIHPTQKTNPPKATP